MAYLTGLLELDEMRLRQTIRGSRALEIVYLNVPKCACTTIKTALWRAAGGGERYRNARQFDPSLRYSFCFKKEDLIKFGPDPYVFTVVRNPFIRVYSAFRDKVVPRSQGDKRPLRAIKKLVRAHGTDANFKSFLHHIDSIPDAQRDPHWRSMTYQTNWNYLVPDFTGATENMDAVVRQLELVTHRTLPLHKRNSRGSAEEALAAYDEEAISMVLDIYKEDFANFGYSCRIENALLPPNTATNRD